MARHTAEKRANRLSMGVDVVERGRGYDAYEEKAACAYLETRANQGFQGTLEGVKDPLSGAYFRQRPLSVVLLPLVFAASWTVWGGDLAFSGDRKAISPSQRRRGYAFCEIRRDFSTNRRLWAKDGFSLPGRGKSAPGEFKKGGKQ